MGINALVYIISNGTTSYLIDRYCTHHSEEISANYPYVMKYTVYYVIIIHMIDNKFNIQKDIGRRKVRKKIYRTGFLE